MHVSCVVLILFGYMTWRWNPYGKPGQDTITVATHNVGQGNVEQFSQFLELHKPDVVLLQDAKNRAPHYAHRFSDYEIISRGEFVLLSRHLVQQSAVLPEPQYHGRPVAARFEIIFQGQPLALYDVHLPTPRTQFNRILSPHIVNELFGAAEDGEEQGYRAWMIKRTELANALAAILAQERRPFIVGGDFNTPDHGPIYRQFSGQLTDAFAHAGRGWGLTFPGETRNPLAFCRPWLRLDYLFSGRGWEPISCEVDSGRKAQHCAVVARFNPIRAGS